MECGFTIVCFALHLCLAMVVLVLDGLVRLAFKRNIYTLADMLSLSLHHAAAEPSRTIPANASRLTHTRTQDYCHSWRALDLGPCNACASGCETLKLNPKRARVRDGASRVWLRTGMALICERSSCE